MSFDLKKLIRSFGFASKGIIAAIISGQNMRIQLLAAIAVIAAGVYFHISVSEWCLVTLCIGMVWMAEAFNTAIEILTNHIQPQFHPEAGKVKDVAAGAVLIISIAAAIVGVLVFWKYLFQLLK